jgi:hypothetical protein
MWIPFDNYLKKLWTLVDSIDHDAVATTVKIALITSAVAPNRVTHSFWSDLQANEVTGVNYTAGGNEIATKTVVVASNIITFDANDPAAWTMNVGGFANARYAIMYKTTGAPSSSPLIAYYDFGTNKGNTGSDFAIQLDAAGIATLAVA